MDIFQDAFLVKQIAGFVFTTPVALSPSSYPIRLSHRLFCVGSCFAQRMGQRWADHKFTTLINPFGTLYNPISIFRLMEYALKEELPEESAYLEREGYYYHYDFHSDLHAPTQEALRALIEQRLQQVRTFVQTADWMVITLGSAFGYELQETNRWVANCHKKPSHLFHKRLLTVEEIHQAFVTLKTLVDTVNPRVHFLMTVSPVRHLRDTLERNSVSKATLRLAAEYGCRQYPQQVHYFPSYEIMLDELRDYRFYEADMLHPTRVAEDYLWRQLTSTYLDQEAQGFVKQWSPLRKALAHRALHPESDSHQRFLRNTLEQLKQLSQKVDVYTEIAQVEQQLQ